MTDRTERSIEEDHEEYVDIWYPTDKLEGWAVGRLKGGTSTEKIRDMLESDRQTKKLHGGKIIDHIIDHARFQAQRELQTDLIRKRAAERQLRSGRLTKEQVRGVAIARSQAERELLTLAEGLDQVFLYRNRKGQFTTTPTDNLVEAFRERKSGRFVARPVKPEKAEDSEK